MSDVKKKEQHIDVEKLLVNNAIIVCKNACYSVVRKVPFKQGELKYYDVKRHKDLYGLFSMVLESKKGSTLTRERAIYANLTGEVLCAAEPDPLIVKHILMPVDYGNVGDFMLTVSPLLGETLDVLINRRLDEEEEEGRRRLDWPTWLKIAVETQRAICALHRAGFVHGNIRPSCFAIGKNYDRNRLLLTDLGVGHPIGSAKVSSPPDLLCGSRRRLAGSSSVARKDDAESWLYLVLFALYPRFVPWSGIPDSDSVLALKRALFHGTFKKLFVSIFPWELRVLIDKIKTLRKDDEPFYRIHEEVIYAISQRLVEDPHGAFSWCRNNCGIIVELSHEKADDDYELVSKLLR